jgi:hypothetical protein
MYILVNKGLGEAPSCTSTDCSAVSVGRFDKQPADLQGVLTKSFKDPAERFGKLDPERECLSEGKRIAPPMLLGAQAT